MYPGVGQTGTASTTGVGMGGCASTGTGATATGVVATTTGAGMGIPKLKRTPAFAEVIAAAARTRIAIVFFIMSKGSTRRAGGIRLQMHYGIVIEQAGATETTKIGTRHAAAKECGLSACRSGNAKGLGALPVQLAYSGLCGRP